MNMNKTIKELIRASQISEIDYRLERNNALLSVITTTMLFGRKQGMKAFEIFANKYLNTNEQREHSGDDLSTDSEPET